MKFCFLYKKNKQNINKIKVSPNYRISNERKWRHEVPRGIKSSLRKPEAKKKNKKQQKTTPPKSLENVEPVCYLFYEN